MSCSTTSDTDTVPIDDLTDLTIDESSPDLAETRLNTGSLLAWSPQSTGVADHYRIDSRKTSADESQRLANFRVHGEKFELPADVVQTRGRYVVSILRHAWPGTDAILRVRRGLRPDVE